MTRLQRTRRGKTPVDVTRTEQNGIRRIRLSMGDEIGQRFRNTDMDDEETENLIIMLAYNLKMLRGEIPWSPE